jgi:hypothetical protein
MQPVAGMMLVSGPELQSDCNPWHGDTAVEVVGCVAVLGAGVRVVVALQLVGGVGDVRLQHLLPGVIYNDSEQQLSNLGVTGPALKKLLADLHYNAITSLERIWKQRGALLKQLGCLAMANYSKNEKARMKAAHATPLHRKHVKRRKTS